MGRRGQSSPAFVYPPASDAKAARGTPRSDAGVGTAHLPTRPWVYFGAFAKLQRIWADPDFAKLQRIWADAPQAVCKFATVSGRPFRKAATDLGRLQRGATNQKAPSLPKPGGFATDLGRPFRKAATDLGRRAVFCCNGFGQTPLLQCCNGFGQTFRGRLTGQNRLLVFRCNGFGQTAASVNPLRGKSRVFSRGRGTHPRKKDGPPTGRGRPPYKNLRDFIRL